MRNILKHIAFLLLAASAFGQSPVTGNLKDILGANYQKDGFVRIRLRNYSGSVPKVSGTGILANTQVDVKPDSSGHISTTVYCNNNILPAGTFYTLEFWTKGNMQSSANYNVSCSTGLNFNSDTPLGNSSLPILNFFGARTFIFTQAVASATWTINHNFGDPNVVVAVYDGSNNAIFPNSIVLTSPNTVTVSFVTPQAGRAVVVNGGAVNILNGTQNVVVQNPTANQHIVGNFATLIDGWLSFNTSGTNPAQSGVLRLEKADPICWRNVADSGDNCITVNGSNALLFNGSPIGGGGSPTFDALLSGVNTSATMTLGTGAALTFSGAGVVNANQFRGVAYLPTGTGSSLVTSTGSRTSGNCVSIDASGNFIDAGGPCSGATAANKTLSNLTAPTAINADLLPTSDDTLNFGSLSKNWHNGYFKGSLFNGNSTNTGLLFNPNGDFLLGFNEASQSGINLDFANFYGLNDQLFTLSFIRNGIGSAPLARFFTNKTGLGSSIFFELQQANSATVFTQPFGFSSGAAANPDSKMSRVSAPNSVFGMGMTTGSVFGLPSISADPNTATWSTGQAGLTWYNNNTNHWKGWNGSSVVTIDGGGGGGSTAWSSLLDPSGNLSLNMAGRITTFTYGSTTGGSNLFNFIDTLNNTGTGYEVSVDTASGSTLRPFRIGVNGSSIFTTNPATDSPLNLVGSLWAWNLHTYALNNTILVDQETGADVGAKINNCVSHLPTNGGICDARGFGQTTQTISTAVNLGSNTKHVTLLVDSTTQFDITVSSGCAITLGEKSGIVGTGPFDNGSGNGTFHLAASGAKGMICVDGTSGLPTNFTLRDFSMTATGQTLTDDPGLAVPEGGSGLLYIRNIAPGVFASVQNVDGCIGSNNGIMLRSDGAGAVKDVGEINFITDTFGVCGQSGTHSAPGYANGRPFRYKAVSGASSGGTINIVGGMYNDPGTVVGGTVDTNGTAVTRVSGSLFVTGTDWVGKTVIINGVSHFIASVASTGSMTLASSAGVHAGVAWSGPGYCGIDLDGGNVAGSIMGVTITGAYYENSFSNTSGLCVKDVQELTVNGFKTLNTLSETANTFVDVTQTSGSSITQGIVLMNIYNATGGTNTLNVHGFSNFDDYTRADPNIPMHVVPGDSARDVVESAAFQVHPFTVGNLPVCDSTRLGQVRYASDAKSKNEGGTVGDAPVGGFHGAHVGCVNSLTPTWVTMD